MMTMLICQASQMTRKSVLTVFMTSMVMEKKLTLKMEKRAQARRNLVCGNKIKLQFQKQKMILCLRLNDATMEMILLEMEILRILMGWILKGETEEKMLG